MGFWDSVIGVGKSAAKAAGNAIDKTMLEQWDKLYRASHDQVRDYYDKNNKPESSNTLKRALAIAALKDRYLFREDEDARRQLLRLRNKFCLEDSQEARNLVRAIDDLER